MKRKIISILSLSLIFVLFLSNFTGSTQAQDPQYDFLGMTDEVVILINEARIKEGLIPLKTVPILRDAATVRANESVVSFTHYRPSGLLFNAVLKDFSIFTLSSAENLGAGYGTPEEVVEKWLESPGHRANIMNPNFTHVGVGMTYAPHGEYRWYWTQVFIKSNEIFYDEYYPQRYYIVPECEGDITGDAEVDLFDLVVLREHLAGKAMLNDLQVDAADCMKDGGLTMLDAIALEWYINHKSPELPMDFNTFWQAQTTYTATE